MLIYGGPKILWIFIRNNDTANERGDFRWGRQYCDVIVMCVIWMGMWFLKAGVLFLINLYWQCCTKKVGSNFELGNILDICLKSTADYNVIILLWHLVCVLISYLKKTSSFSVKNPSWLLILREMTTTLYTVFNLKLDRILILVIYLLRFTTFYITQVTSIYNKCWKWCPFISMHLSTRFITFLATFLRVLSFTSLQ